MALILMEKRKHIICASCSSKSLLMRIIMALNKFIKTTYRVNHLNSTNKNNNNLYLMLLLIIIISYTKIIILIKNANIK